MTDANPFRRPPVAFKAPLGARIGALLIDAVLLAAAGALLGIFFGDRFQAWGPWARLVGLPIALAYLGLGAGRLLGGQTLGKRLLRLRVVSEDGATLGIGRGLARASLVALPWLFASWPVLRHHRATAALAALCAGFFPAQLLLLFFNRPNRQLIHDRLMGTYVLHPDDPLPEATTGTRLFIVSAIIPVLFVLASVTAVRTGAGPRVGALLALRDSLLAQTPAFEVNINDGWTALGTRPAATELDVIAWVPPRSGGDSLAAAEIARIALRVMPDARDRGALAVTLAHGYDIMIWRVSWTEVYRRTPAEWLAPFIRAPGSD